METIKYKDQTITPIMKPMLVWDDDESKAVERFVYAKDESNDFPWKAGGKREGGWKNAKPIPEEVEMTVAEISKALGKKVKVIE